VSAHKVKKHKWINGVLETTEHVFDSLEAALQFCNKKSNQDNVHVMKVYTPEGELAHEVSPNNSVPANTYA